MQALKLEERIDCISWIPMILVPEALEIMLVYTQNGTCDIVMAGYSIICPGKRPVACSSSWKKTRALADIQKDILLNRLPNFVWGKLYRKILWNEVRFPVANCWKICINGGLLSRHRVFV